MGGKKRNQKDVAVGGGSLRMAILASLQDVPAEDPKPAPPPKKKKIATTGWRGAVPSDCRTVRGDSNPAFHRSVRGLLSADLVKELLSFARDVQGEKDMFRWELDRSRDRTKAAVVEHISNGFTIKIDVPLFNRWAKRDRNAKSFVNRVKRIRKDIEARLSANDTVLESHCACFPQSTKPKWTTVHLLVNQPGAKSQLPHADDWLGRAMVVNCFLQDGVRATEICPGLPKQKEFRHCQLGAYKKLFQPNKLKFEPVMTDVKEGDGVCFPATQVHRGPGNVSEDMQRIVLFCADSPFPLKQSYNPKFQLHALLLTSLMGRCVHTKACNRKARMENRISDTTDGKDGNDNGDSDGGDVGDHQDEWDDVELLKKEVLLMEKVKKAYKRVGYSLDEHA